jgi:hypothetical protein
MPVMLALLMEVFYEVRSWDGLRIVEKAKKETSIKWSDNFITTAVGTSNPTDISISCTYRFPEWSLAFSFADQNTYTFLMSLRHASCPTHLILLEFMNILTYLRTELSPSWEAANCADIQKISSNFKEPEGSSPCSQEPSTGPYPEPVRSSPHHPILSL